MGGGGVSQGALVLIQEVLQSQILSDRPANKRHGPISGLPSAGASAGLKGKTAPANANINETRQL